MGATAMISRGQEEKRRKDFCHIVGSKWKVGCLSLLSAPPPLFELVFNPLQVQRPKYTMMGLDSGVCVNEVSSSLWWKGH